MQSLLKFLISRRFAVWLLVLSVSLLFIAVTLPTPEEVSMTERPYYHAFIQIFGIQGITSSPYSLILPAFISLSTFLCTVNRLRRQRVKDAGFWGSMVFHLGILTIITAGVVSMLTLFSGEMLLTEGFPASLGREGFLKIWRTGGVKMPEGSVTLTGFKGIYKDNFPVDYEARLSLETAGGGREETVRVNEPLIIDGIRYTLNRYGFSPAFVVEDDKGNILLDAFINLVVVGGAEDSFEVPGTGATAYVRFFPDFAMTKDGPVSISKVPNNPVAAVKVGRGNEESRFRLIKKGEKARIMGLTFTFSDLRQWNHFLVSKDQGQPVLAAGLLLLISGLTLRFLTMKEKREDS